MWAERWNADRLVVGVEEALARWPDDPRRAAVRVDRLLGPADPRAIVWLETLYRRRHRTLAGVVGADDLGAYGPYDAAVAALLTFDRNGYLRQAGVARLAGSTAPFVLPFLLLRLNDPVEAVRERATVAVGARVGGCAPSVLVRLVPLVKGLRTRVRAAPLVESVVGRLLAEGRPDLWAGARGDDPAVRAECLRLLATVEPAEALEEAMKTRDPVLRVWATTVATASTQDPDVQRRLLPVIERDSNPRLRWQALRARTRRPDSAPHLRRARLDPDARVRYLARVSLKALGEAGSADVYRAALADPAANRDTLIGALAGLADMGGSADAARVVPFLQHPTARVRREALRALTVLDPETSWTG